MGEFMRALDWNATPLGPPENWPHSLKVAVRIVLASRYAMFVWWGPELTNLYNDAYLPFLGVKHPSALGRSARDVWAEIWDQRASSSTTWRCSSSWRCSQRLSGRAGPGWGGVVERRGGVVRKPGRFTGAPPPRAGSSPRSAR